jgi:hypothetical protein
MSSAVNSGQVRLVRSRPSGHTRHRLLVREIANLAPVVERKFRRHHLLPTHLTSRLAQYDAGDATLTGGEGLARSRTAFMSEKSNQRGYERWV